MSLEKSRSESVALLKTVAGDEQASAEKRSEAQSEIIRIAKDIEKEAVTKELLSQKGFSEVSVFLNSPQATVSVKGDGLTPDQVAKIRDTMRHDGNILPQNLTIIERK
jgi:GMP synthase PP-ATPase subunit